MNKKVKEIGKHTLAHLFLLTCVCAALFPLMWIFSTSIRASGALYTTELQLIPDEVTFKYYRMILTDSSFLKWALNSFYVAGLATFLSLLFGVSAAYAYSRFRFVGRELALSLFLLLNAFPSVLTLIAMYKILSVFRIEHSLLGIIIIYTGGQLVFTIWNLKGYLDTIPKELEEAAYMDGASRNRTFIQVILPLARPALAVTAVFAFLASWNEYVVAMTFILDKDKFTLPVGIYNLQAQGSSFSANWPLFAAGSIITAIPAAIIFILLQRNIVSGLALGGVKG